MRKNASFFFVFTVLLALVFVSCKKHSAEGQSGSCNAATAFTASGITTSGAVISWTAASGSAAQSYSVEYKLSGSQAWVSAGVASAATIRTLNGLQANASYDVRIGTNCSGGPIPYLAGSFQTLAGSGTTNCDAPAGFTSSGITATSATVGWNAVGGATQYAVEYAVAGTTSWISAGAATTNTTFELTNLSAGVVYNVRISATCTGGTSNYLTGQLTTTAGGGGGACIAPTGFGSSAVTSNSAVISWTASAGVTSYSVEYRINGAGGGWTTWGNVTGTSFTLTGLQSNTTYRVKIESNCTTGHSPDELEGIVTTLP